MRRTLLLVAALAALPAAGCHSNPDRPRLLDRLFHRDDDCPSNRAAARGPACDRPSAAACDRPGPTLGAPVSYTGPASGDPYTIGPGAFDARPDNELPSPRIGPPNPAVPTPANPNSLQTGGGR